MDSLDALAEKAKSSMLFTAPVLEADLARFLDAQAERIRALAFETMQNGTQQVYWVGSGNSWCNLYSGKYLLDRFSALPTDYFSSYELVWRAPQRLNERALAIFASYSGATEDTLNALQFAKGRGARTVCLINHADSPMGELADVTIPYESKALFSLPLAAAYLFALEVARLEGIKDVERISAGVMALPALMGRLYREEAARAKGLALEFQNERLFYTLGAGPLYGLAYKFGLTVFMENMRVNGSFIETSEFRHGPIEMLEREKPAMVFLIGTDESRAMSLRVLDQVRQRGARTIVYDLADYNAAYGEVHPLLAPFVLKIPLQWFAVYSALARGITDLDERVFMGRGTLSQGARVTWP